MPAVVNISLLEKALTYDFFARASNLVSLTLNDNHGGILSYMTRDAIPEIPYFRYANERWSMITTDNGLIRGR